MFENKDLEKAIIGSAIHESNMYLEESQEDGKMFLKMYVEVCGDRFVIVVPLENSYIEKEED